MSYAFVTMQPSMVFGVPDCLQVTSETFSVLFLQPRSSRITRASCYHADGKFIAHLHASANSRSKIIYGVLYRQKFHNNDSLVMIKAFYKIFDMYHVDHGY